MKSYENFCFENNILQCTYPYCEVKLKYISDYKEHVRKHFKTKILKCSKCERRFSSKFVIKNHILSHITNRPYCCFEKSCLSTFINLSLLKFHYKSKHLKKEDMKENDNEEYYEEEFNKCYVKNKSDIEGKIKNYHEEYKEFLTNYPIVNINNEFKEKDKKLSLLHQKRHSEITNDSIMDKVNEKFKTISTSHTYFSKEEKIILILNEFIQNKFNFEALLG